MTTDTHKPADHGANSQTAPVVVPVAVKRRKVQQVAATAIEKPDWAGLSFTKAKLTRFGWDCSDWFNVPPQSYGEGLVTGYKIADELMHYVRPNVWGHERANGLFVLSSVIQAAAVILASPARQNGKDKRGAAQALMNCVSRLVASGNTVSTGRNRCMFAFQWVKVQIDLQTQLNEELAKDEAEEKAKFAERAKLSRKVKKQSKALEVSA